MIEGCTRQLRVGMAGPFGLDFGAVLAMGDAAGADKALLASVLPAVEDAILAGLNDEGAEDE